ncbi:MAG: hypothetical protein Q9166_005305 [cf. Caloplaca sp. 2 TL-2023]
MACLSICYNAFDEDIYRALEYDPHRGAPKPCEKGKELAVVDLVETLQKLLEEQADNAYLVRWNKPEEQLDNHLKEKKAEYKKSLDAAYGARLTSKSKNYTSEKEIIAMKYTVLAEWLGQRHENCYATFIKGDLESEEAANKRTELMKRLYKTYNEQIATNEKPKQSMLSAMLGKAKNNTKSYE